MSFFQTHHLRRICVSPSVSYILALVMLAYIDLFISLSFLSCDPYQGSGQSGGSVTQQLCVLRKVT